METGEMATKIIRDLGENYRDDNEVLIDIVDEVRSIAYNTTNNSNYNDLFPYIKTAVKSIYLKRGSEGLNSLTMEGVSSNFADEINKMRTDLILDGHRRMK